MRSARASASRQRPNGAGRSIRLKNISYDVGRKLAAAAWSPAGDVNVMTGGESGLPFNACCVSDAVLVFQAGSAWTSPSSFSRR